MAKTKFIRVMTEGATTDGRNIERAWIEQMARNYNPARYGARIWMEHLRGMGPDSIFRAYGDVIALKADKVEDGRLALFAQLDPTEDLVAMNKLRQKIYTSAEVDPNFARSGEAYLVGLAVTDTPASLGTEMLQFAAGAREGNPLAARKQSADNLFTAAQPTTIEFEDPDMTTTNKPEAKPGDEAKTLLSGLLALLKPEAKPETPPPAAPDAALPSEFSAAVTLLAQHQAETVKSLGEFATTVKSQQEAGAKAITELTASVGKLTADFAALKASLDAAPGDGTNRPPASGGNGDNKTDC